MSHGLVTAPRSHAVIIMDLSGNAKIHVISHFIGLLQKKIFSFFKRCVALPAHVPVSLHIPVVLSVADQLEEQVPVPARAQKQHR